jgi:hypothetical protein
MQALSDLAEQQISHMTMHCTLCAAKATTLIPTITHPAGVVGQSLGPAAH